MPTDSKRLTHWDFMLRDAEKLLTWALETEPSAGFTLAAKRLPDHDLKYLEYEGNINHNRGRVKRIARGRYRWLERAGPCRFRISLTFEDRESDSAWELLVQHRDDEFDEFHFWSPVKKSSETHW